MSKDNVHEVITIVLLTIVMAVHLWLAVKWKRNKQRDERTWAHRISGTRLDLTEVGEKTKF